MTEYINRPIWRKNRGTYKSIDFDKKELGKYHKDYRWAYKDIRNFTEAHGFSHRQGSVYNLKKSLLDTDIIMLMGEMVKEFPWAKTCVEELDVTNVGRMHSMLPYLRADDENYDYE